MSGQLAVVTGASSGIGAATAQALGARGWTVVLVARRQAPLDALAIRIAAVGADPVVAALDAADPDTVAAMADGIRAEHGVPDVIVNAAGVGGWRWPEDTTPAEMENSLDAPFRAAFHVTQAFLGDMIARGSGRIVHVGSPAAIQPWPGATAYTISRWALRGYHEALRQDLAGTGVTTSHVAFTEVTTPYFDTNPGARERRPWLGRLARTLTPAETAEVILRTIDRPRPQVLHPAMLRVLVVVHRMAPGVATWFVRITGAKRAVGS